MQWTVRVQSTRSEQPGTGTRVAFWATITIDGVSWTSALPTVSAVGATIEEAVASAARMAVHKEVEVRGTFPLEVVPRIGRR